FRHDMHVTGTLEKDCNAPKFFQLRLENPHAFINWCEREYNATLEWKKLENVGNEFARTIVWDEIKMLEYDHLVLSFIIDFTQPQKKFQHIISQVFDKVTCIPEEGAGLLASEFQKGVDLRNQISEFF
ncbi:11411_t:CDS:2, partial [Entrophospora sp. SA101]